METQRCTGKGARAGLAVTFMAMGLAPLVVMVQLAHDSKGGLGGGALPVVIMFGAITALILVGGLALLREARAVYVWDDAGLTRRRWLAAQYVPWHEITGYELRCNTGEPEYRLQRAVGKPLIVNFATLSTNGWDLLAELQRRLEPHRQRKLAELERDGRGVGVLKNQRVAGRIGAIVMLAMTVGFLALALCSPREIRPVLFCCVGLFGVLMLVGVGAQVRQGRRSTMLTAQGITLGDGPRTTELPWPFVERIELSRTASNGQTFETLTIQGQGRKVALSSWYPDYLLLLEYVLKHAINAQFLDRSGVAARPVWHYLEEQVVNPQSPTVTEPAAPKPTAVRRAWLPQLAVIVGAICLQAGAQMLPRLDRSGHLQAAMSHPPVVARAVILRYCNTEQPDKTHIHYSFLVDGKAQEGKSEPLGAALKRYVPGRWVTIHYPYSMPDRSGLLNEPLELPHAAVMRPSVCYSLLGFGAALLLLGGLSGARAARAQRLQRASGAWSAGGR